MDIEDFYPVGYNGSKDFSQSDITNANASGFSAATDDYMERGIDLNEQLIKNKPATFFMRVSGNNMISAGIGNGDVLIVDRSVKPENDKIVIAVIEGEMLIRRIEITNTKQRLIGGSSKFLPVDLNEHNDVQIWGVVTYVIHAL